MKTRHHFLSLMILVNFFPHFSFPFVLVVKKKATGERERKKNRIKTVPSRFICFDISYFIYISFFPYSLFFFCFAYSKNALCSIMFAHLRYTHSQRKQIESGEKERVNERGRKRSSSDNAATLGTHI